MTWRALSGKENNKHCKDGDSQVDAQWWRVCGRRATGRTACPVTCVDGEPWGGQHVQWQCVDESHGADSMFSDGVWMESHEADSMSSGGVWMRATGQTACPVFVLV